MVELVVLVNEQNQVLGQADKATVHGPQTPLHRAFSLFIFDNQQRLLLQQRSAAKKTWPLVWSNSCCGHPMLHESNVEAAKRRCQFELGLDISHIIEVLPYRYCFTHQGVMENEICPVLVAMLDDGDINRVVAPNSDEVEAVRWVAWSDWLQQIADVPADFSPWCVEESQLLAGTDFFALLQASFHVR
ncbi:MAG: isopentenyl-diphosphate delta-isomerase [Phenylobacterium sp.]|jgi:isopentenyl-diphosphate delta-isomerase